MEPRRIVRAAIDHLVVTAPSLASGAEFIRRELGVEMQPGGEHPRMGTHNLLLNVGDATYLEVIAINPRAPVPEHPRWFGLDRLDAAAEPRLAAWVARVDNIHAAAAALHVDPRHIMPMSRGTLSWLIAVPPDHGITPLLIQWLDGPHPASALPISHCALVSLRGHGPDPVPDRGIEFESRWSFVLTDPGQPARLTASIQTPSGMRTLAG